MSNVVKPDFYKKLLFGDTDFKSSLNDSANFVDINDVGNGEEARESIKKLETKDKAILKSEIKKFNIESVKHITIKINYFIKIKYFTCLSPKNIKNFNSIRYAIKIVTFLPLNNSDSHKVSNE